MSVGRAGGRDPLAEAKADYQRVVAHEGKEKATQLYTKVKEAMQIVKQAEAEPNAADKKKLMDKAKKLDAEIRNLGTAGESARIVKELVILELQQRK